MLHVLMSMQMCVDVHGALHGIAAEKLRQSVCVCYHYYYIMSHKVRLGL